MQTRVVIITFRTFVLQAALFATAREFRDANIVDVATFAELKDAISEGKWARGPWAGAPNHHTAAGCASGSLHGRAWQHNCEGSVHAKL